MNAGEKIGLAFMFLGAMQALAQVLAERYDIETRIPLCPLATFLLGILIVMLS